MLYDGRHRQQRSIIFRFAIYKFTVLYLSCLMCHYFSTSICLSSAYESLAKPNSGRKVSRINPTKKNGQEMPKFVDNPLMLMDL